MLFAPNEDREAHEARARQFLIDWYASLPQTEWDDHRHRLKRYAALFLEYALSDITARAIDEELHEQDRVEVEDLIQAAIIAINFHCFEQFTDSEIEATLLEPPFTDLGNGYGLILHIVAWFFDKVMDASIREQMDKFAASAHNRHPLGGPPSKYIP